MEKNDDDDDDDGVEDNDAHKQVCSDDSSQCTNQIIAVDNDSNDSHHSFDANYHSQEEVPKQQLEAENALQQRLHTIFQSLNDNTISTTNLSKPKSNSKKSMSKQVRTMLMKSKSLGNSKIKQEDRIYLEVIFFRDGGVMAARTADATTPPHSTSSYRYFSKQTDLRQIMDVVSKSIPDDAGEACIADTIEFIVPSRCQSNDEVVVSYKSLEKSMTLGDAIQSGYIDNFGLVILRAHNHRW